LRAPFVTGWGAIDHRELLLLSLEDSSGRIGYGEAAPLEPYDGVNMDDVVGAIEDCRATLIRVGVLDRADLLAQCAQLTVVPHALAAIDLALWDLTGRQQGRPLWHLLGATSCHPVDVNYTVNATDRAGAAAEADVARAAGYRCLKVKVGVGDDAGRVAAVRAVAGREAAIRLDANGAWSVDEARAALEVLEPAGIELCEEPVHGFDEVEQLSRQIDVPLALDESGHLAGALDRRFCDSVCLKVGLSGGVTGLLDVAGKARRAGYRLYLASALDGPIGIAAALHAACAVRPDRPSGLATLQIFSDRLDPMPPVGGRIAVPDGPGLGDGLIRWYRR
jgi:o-succinylbenzoate synthase